jgi:hypothetical protein
MNKPNPMEDTKLDIDGRLLWSATILLVEPYRDTNDFTAPEGTQARVITTSKSFLTPMSPKDFADKFGFALLEHDNVAANPYHFPRKNDGSYTFQVEEARLNATTRDGAKAYTRLSYRAGGDNKFTNLTTDSNTVFDLVNPKPKAAQSPPPAEPAQSGQTTPPKRPGKRGGPSPTSDDNSGPGG